MERRGRHEQRVQGNHIATGSLASAWKTRVEKKCAATLRSKIRTRPTRPADSSLKKKHIRLHSRRSPHCTLATTFSLSWVLAQNESRKVYEGILPIVLIVYPPVVVVDWTCLYLQIVLACACQLYLPISHVSLQLTTAGRNLRPTTNRSPSCYS